MVELLWVMTIIAVLAAGVLSGLAAARRGFMRTKAEAQTKQVANAFIAYYNTYGRWPGPSGVYQGQVDWDHLQPLIIPDQNPKRILFMEMKLDKSTTNQMRQLIDPWGNVYQFRVATGGVNQNVSPDPFTGSGSLNVSVAIWSAGADKQADTSGYSGVNADNPKNW